MYCTIFILFRILEYNIILINLLAILDNKLVTTFKQIILNTNQI